MQLEETLAFTRIHEADDQWNGHINEIAKKTTPKLLEGNQCVSSSQTKTNTTRKSAVIMWQFTHKASGHYLHHEMVVLSSVLLEMI
jgi:hypothetical protein